jgi:phage terminase small subunit
MDSYDRLKAQKDAIEAKVKLVKVKPFVDFIKAMEKALENLKKELVL